MAQQNYFTNWTQAVTDAIAGQTGLRLAYEQNTVTLLATDNINSTYLLFKNVPFNARIKRLDIENDAIGTGTSFHIGLYNSATGAVKNASCLASALNLSTAHTKTQNTTAANSALDGLAALTHDNSLQPLYLLAGDSLSANGAQGNYDIVMTCNQNLSGGGKVTARMELMPAG